MRYRILLLMIVSTVLLWSCDDMYEKQSEFEGEIVYPAKFDTIIGKIGFERVEIDLLKAGRIPASQIKMGKAKKTVIEYDDEVITIDTLASWVNITGLTQSKLYRFQIYSIDEFGNKSVPQEIALIPFTSTDLASYAVSPPRVMSSPSAAVIDWPNGITSVLMDYTGLSFEYTDKDGVVRNGERGSDSRFFIGNVSAGQAVNINMNYSIIPKINRVRILDTVNLVSTLVINMPTSSTTFPVSEREIMEANGVTTYTADGVSSIEKLVYPIHASSLQDIFYFPNLKTLDLTGGDLFKLPTTVYDRNGVVDPIGGGDYAPFMRRAGDIASGNTQALKDLLEAGILQKVYYRPNTMGLDNLLQPFVESGVVELVEGPSSVLIDHQFHLDGLVQDGNFRIDYTFPATDAPAGEGIVNPYKLIMRARSSSFVFALPQEYQFNADDYRYLKFKVYAPKKDVLTGPYADFQRIWPRIMNRMWSFGQFSNFGQEYWAVDHIWIPDADLQNWKDITIDMANARGKHNRVIILNIGGEPGINPWNPPADIVYYFSNVRFEKEP